MTHTVMWWHHLLEPEGSVHSSYISSFLHKICHPTATPSLLSGFPGREEVGEAPFWLTPLCAGLSRPHSPELSWAVSHRLSHTLTGSNMNTKATGPMSLKHCIGSLYLGVCFTHSPTLPHTCAFRHLFFFCLFLFGIGGSFKEQGSVLFALFAVSHSLLVCTICFALLLFVLLRTLFPPLKEELKPLWLI